MAHGAPANERLSNLMHLDSALQAGEDPLLFQGILKRQPIDDRGKHAHVIAGGAVDGERLLARAAKNVSAADDDSHLHAQVVNLLHVAGNTMNGFGVNSETLRPL